jgi:uncharacterized protein YodC (DUF2158 family)
MDRKSRVVLEVGDVVVLNSGGAQMTVDQIKGTSAVCVWQDANNIRQRETYEQAALTKVPRLSQEEWVKLVAKGI